MNDMYITIYEKLSTLQWLMRRHQMICQSELGAFADTSRGQGRILAMLKIQPEITTKDLSYLLGIRQQSLNELLNKLEKNGYTERKPSKNDKRVMVVHLTEKGKQVQQPETNYQEILDCLSLEELQQFGEYLDKIIGALEAKTNDDNEEDTMTNWVNKARERIGNEQFEQLMSMRERAFGHFGRREMPNNMPQAERFSADYDGFVPNRRRHQFFDDRNMPENRRDMSSNMRNMPSRNMPNNMTDIPSRNMPNNMADMSPRNMPNNMTDMPPRNMPNNMTDMPSRNMPNNMTDMPSRNIPNNMTDMPSRNMPNNMADMPPRNMPNNMTDMPSRNMPNNMADMPPRNMPDNTINSKNSK